MAFTEPSIYRDTRDRLTVPGRQRCPIYEEVWRKGRIFVGLRVDLTKVTKQRMRELVEDAWRNRAPKRLIAEYNNRTADGPSTRPTAG